MNDEEIYVIQENVPICPECKGALRFNTIMQKFICYHCNVKFKPIGQGQTEREFNCVKEKN